MHLGVCENCSNMIQKCPFCKEIIYSRRQVYKWKRLGSCLEFKKRLIKGMKIRKIRDKIPNDYLRKN